MIRNMDDPTAHYYTENATDFFRETVDVDMTPLYDRFLPRLLATIRQADQVDLAVAFIKRSGLDLLLDALRETIELTFRTPIASLGRYFQRRRSRQLARHMPRYTLAGWSIGSPPH